MGLVRVPIICQIRSKLDKEGDLVLQSRVPGAQVCTSSNWKFVYTF